MAHRHGPGNQPTWSKDPPPELGAMEKQLWKIGWAAGLDDDLRGWEVRRVTESIKETSPHTGPEHLKDNEAVQEYLDAAQELG